jgi:hypothetical protein
MNSPLGGVKPSWDCLYVSMLTIFVLPPLPLSHDWCMVKNNPPSHFSRHGGLCKLNPEHCLISTQNRHHMEL